MSQKRPGNSLVPAQDSKRNKNHSSLALQEKNFQDSQRIERTSTLLAPTMQLEGHEGEIFSANFHPEGSFILSAGFDRKILVWNADRDCANVLAMTGHTGAILEAHFSSDGCHIYSCSTDKSVCIWDLYTAQRLRRLKGHESFVNAMQCTRRGLPLIVSGSDDRTVRLWDARKKHSIQSLDARFPVTAVSFNDTGDCLISGGIDNDINVWDVRKMQILHRLQGHSDTITGIALSPDGSYVLSNAMDSTLRIWDIRPYAPMERCVKILNGHQHNFEKNLLRCAWSPDGSKVTAGSSDRYVYVWDTTTRRILYKLPGHNGSVNSTDFHCKQPLILSGSSDKTLYVGEIEC